jgi:hypothetical protein
MVAHLSANSEAEELAARSRSRIGKAHLPRRRLAMAQLTQLGTAGHGPQSASQCVKGFSRISKPLIRGEPIEADGFGVAKLSGATGFVRCRRGFWFNVASQPQAMSTHAALKSSRGHLHNRHHIGHHMRHVVGACGAWNEITNIFQSFIRPAPGGLTSRHIARSAISGLARWVHCVLLGSVLTTWLIKPVDVVTSLGHCLPPMNLASVSFRVSAVASQTHPE